MIPITYRNFKYIKGKNLRNLVQQEYILKNSNAQQLIRYYPDNDDDIIVIDYDDNNKKNLKILEDARKDLLELLFKRFIKENFNNNIKEATIIFQGNWALPLYTDKNNYFGINTSDDPIDILLPLSLQDFSVLEYAMGLIEIIDTDNKISRYTDDDIIFDNVHDIIIPRPKNFPTYENLDDCIIEYNYFHNDSNIEFYKISKIAKVTDDKVYFYNQNGGVVNE